MDRTRKQYDMINVFRVICAYLIIVIHTVGFQCFGDGATFITSFWICMAAIPFFFATSGYFLYENYKKEHYLAQYLKKLAIIFVVATIMFLPFCLPEIWGEVTTKGFRYNWITFVITSLPGHLWYISTLMMSAVVVYFFIKKDWMKPLIVLSLLLFIITVLGQGYFKVLASTNPVMVFIDKYNIVFDRIRNGFAFGVPYMTMGVVVNKYKLNEKINKPFLWLILSMILYAVEGYIFFAYKTGYESYTYFSHILLIPVLLIVLLNSKVSLSNQTSRTLRDVSLWIYLYHPLIIQLFRRVMPSWFEIDLSIDNFHMGSVSLLRFGITSLIITPIAFLIVVIMRKIKAKKVIGLIVAEVLTIK